MNKKYLPSKQFTKIALISLGVIVLIYFIVLYAKTYTTLKHPTITTTTVPVQELLEKDTDNDGVKDWEEVLWGTNVNSPATFGMPDKEYVNNRRKEIATKNDAGSDTGEKLNDTEKIAREFLTTILTLKQSGSLNAFNISNLAQKFSKDIGTQADLQITYTEKNLIAGPDTVAGKKAYYAAFSKAISTAKKGGMGSELASLANYFSEDNSDTTELVKIADTYSALTKSLKNMAVPPSANVIHLALMNESENMAKIFKNITELNDNSIVGLIAISQFEANEPEIEKTIQSFITYFKTNAIIK